LNTWRVRVFIF
jgi:Ca2+-dependent lipid-binding protein